MQIVDETNGGMIDVFTAAELDAKIAEKETAIKAEYEPKIAEFGKTQAELAEAKKALGDRASEFRQFRKLSDEAVAKLTVTEQTLYNNNLLLQEQMEKNKTLEKSAYESKVDSALREKAGSDDKLFAKMKETWGIIGIDAQTPEQIEHKSRMVLGAIGVAEPNLVASAAGFSGGYTPPVQQGSKEQSFADTERGRAGAAELGFIIEAPKK